MNNVSSNLSLNPTEPNRAGTFDQGYTYLMHGRQERSRINEDLRAELLTTLRSVALGFRQLAIMDPNFQLSIVYQDPGEPDWAESVGVSSEGRMGSIGMFEVIDSHFDLNHNLRLYITHIAPDQARLVQFQQLILQAVGTCRLLVRRPGVSSPLVWWGLELIRLAWRPHPVLIARRAFRWEIFNIDVDLFTGPRSRLGEFWRGIYDDVDKVPRSWIATLKLDAASASAILTDQFVRQFEAASKLDDEPQVAPLHNTNLAEAASEGGPALPSELTDSMLDVIEAIMQLSCGDGRCSSIYPTGSRIAKKAFGGNAESRTRQLLAELDRLGMTRNRRKEGAGNGYFLTSKGIDVAKQARTRRRSMSA